MTRLGEFKCEHCGTVLKMQAMYTRYHGDACKYMDSGDGLTATLMTRANVPLGTRLKTVLYVDYVERLKKQREKTE